MDTTRQMVDRHPRDNFTLVTKLHAGFIKTKEDCDRIFNALLARQRIVWRADSVNGYARSICRSSII